MSEESWSAPNLPPNWVRCTINDVTTPVEKIDPRNAPNAEISYIDISGIDNSANRIHEVKSFRLADAPSRARQIVRAGDILFSTVRPYLRNIAQVPDKFDGEVASTGFSVLRPAAWIDPGFLFFKSISKEFVDTLSAEQYGVSYPAVKDSQVRAQPILLPPLNEQRRIVEKIETLFTRLDKGEEALRTVQKLLARYRQSVLKAAVTGELTVDWRAKNAHRLEHGRDLLTRILKTRRENWSGRGKYKEPVAPESSNLPELPEGWVWASLEQIGFVQSGQTPKQIDEYINPVGTIPWFKVSSMNQLGNEVEMQTSRWMLTEEGAKAAGLNTMPRGTIVFPKRGGAILTNKKRRLGCVAALDLNTMGFIPVGLEGYVWTFFQGLDLTQIYDGSNVPQINYPDIANLPIAIPSCDDEAVTIADCVNARIEQVKLLENWCVIELARSASLRQSILKDAFSGRLVDQDPDDEPASELLTRIEATQTPTRKTKRGRAPA